MERTIQVVGRSELNIPPDSVEFSLTLETRDSNYQEVLKKHQMRKSKLVESLVNSDFDEKELKTTSFSVRPIYQYVDGKEVFDTYQAYESLTMVIDNQSELINRVLNALEESNEDVKFQMRYMVKDRGVWEKELLTSAMNHSYENATILAQSIGKKVGDAIQISLGNTNLNFYSPTVLEAREIAMDFTPQDITLSEQVSVIWEMN